MSKTITISDSDYNMIMDCIRQNYAEYTGDNEIDQDVYEFNTQLDNLIERIK